MCLFKISDVQKAHIVEYGPIPTVLKQIWKINKNIEPQHGITLTTVKIKQFTQTKTVSNKDSGTKLYILFVLWWRYHTWKWNTSATEN